MARAKAKSYDRFSLKGNSDAYCGRLDLCKRGFAVCVGRRMVADPSPQADTAGAAPQAAAPAPAAAPAKPKAPCANPDALGIARVVEIDTTGGPGFGFEHFKQLDFLRDKEVVLTFDDGPWPVNTPAVLKALAERMHDRHLLLDRQARDLLPGNPQAGLRRRPHHRLTHVVARHADQQEAHRRSAQGRDRKRLQRREVGAGRRVARAILPLPSAAASAGNGDLSRHPQYRDVLLRPRLLRFQGAQPSAGDRRHDEEARQARQGHHPDARLPQAYRGSPARIADAS